MKDIHHEGRTGNEITNSDILKRWYLFAGLIYCDTKEEYIYFYSRLCNGSGKGSWNNMYKVKRGTK